MAFIETGGSARLTAEPSSQQEGIQPGSYMYEALRAEESRISAPFVQKALKAQRAEQAKSQPQVHHPGNVMPHYPDIDHSFIPQTSVAEGIRAEEIRMDTIREQLAKSATAQVAEAA